MSRKNVYIIVIVVCMLGTVGVLYYGFHTPTYTPPPAPVNNSLSAGTTAEPNPTTFVTTPQGRSGNYSAPSVFPADSRFDWSLLDSPDFQKLSSVPDLQQDPSQFGKTNPFIANK